MNFSSLHSILYELQPARMSDVLYWVKWVNINALEILKSVLEVVEYGKQEFPELSKYLTIINLLSCATWTATLVLFHSLDCGSLWILISLFSLIFFNLRDSRGDSRASDRGDNRRDELSAYSVFNQGFQSILGSLTASHFDDQLRHRGDVDDVADEVERGREFVDKRLVRKGKKARRGYEDKLKRRLLENRQDLSRENL